YFFKINLPGGSGRLISQKILSRRRGETYFPKITLPRPPGYLFLKKYSPPGVGRLIFEKQASPRLGKALFPAGRWPTASLTIPPRGKGGALESERPKVTDA